MYRIAVCGCGEAMDRIASLIRDVLHGREIVYELAVYRKPKTMLQQIESEDAQYHLVLFGLDEDGVACARRLREGNGYVGIVFVGDGLLQDCLRVHPLQVLSHPVSRELLEEVVLYVYRYYCWEQCLVLQDRSKLVRIPHDRILYLETKNRGVEIHFADCGDDPSSIWWRGKLGEFEKQLPSALFCRCHNSFLVNLHYMQYINRYEAALANGRRLPVSKTYYREIRNAFAYFFREVGINCSDGQR